MPDPQPTDIEYAPYAQVEADAGATLLSLFTCKECGATVTVDPRDRDEDSTLQLHAEWHARRRSAAAQSWPGRVDENPQP